MLELSLTRDEQVFTSSRVRFLEAVRAQYGEDHEALSSDLQCPARPMRPVIIGDPRALTTEEREELREAFYGPAGVAAFHLLDTTRDGHHPLLDLAGQCADILPTRWAVDHPMEGHAEAQARFGAPDGTLKIYNLPVEAGGRRYREQAETDEAFDAHNDGLGYAGIIAVTSFVLENPPLWGGYTHFANIVRASPWLARSDPEAFQALFLPDAITCLRPRGKGAIRVTSPVLYLGPDGSPRVFLRVKSGEYGISWRRGLPALDRGRRFCEDLARPFSCGSTFVHLMRRGDGVLVRNQHVVHGRTSFIDPPSGPGRTLARKWFVEREGDTSYRHVPGMAIQEDYAKLFPRRFGEGRVAGEWHYDAELDDNVRVPPSDCQ